MAVTASGWKGVGSHRLRVGVAGVIMSTIMSGCEARGCHRFRVGVAGVGHDGRDAPTLLLLHPRLRLLTGSGFVISSIRKLSI